MRKIDGPHLPKQVIFISEKVTVATFSGVAALGIGFLIVTGIAWMSYWSLPLMPGKDLLAVTVSAQEIPVSNEDSENTEKTITPKTPTRIQISALNIDTTIQQVGTTKRGAMDVPTKTNEVGWFNLGYKPGEIGNSVITGHFDTLWMRPAIFARINELKETDEIVITDESNQNWVFSVKKVEVFPLKEVPINELFGKSDTPKLNLITCSGRWSWKMGSYSERTVVRTELLRADPTAL